jgi:hypothetical protein
MIRARGENRTMATQKEIKRLGDDLAAVRRLANSLLEQGDCDWTAWELEFLDAMAARSSDAPLSTRQREMLSALRDSARTYRLVEGLSIPRLIDTCWLERFDLDDDDAAFIERLKAEQPVATLKHRPAYRLLAIARSLDLAPRFANAG